MISICDVSLKSSLTACFATVSVIVPAVHVLNSACEGSEGLSAPTPCSVEQNRVSLSVMVIACALLSYSTTVGVVCTFRHSCPLGLFPTSSKSKNEKEKLLMLTRLPVALLTNSKSSRTELMVPSSASTSCDRPPMLIWPKTLPWP